MPGKRLHNKSWKRIYGVDLGYTRRVDAAKARGEYTPTKAELLQATHGRQAAIEAAAKVR